MKALTQLVNLILFMMCVYLIFAILGMMIFQGRFYQRCRMTAAPDNFGNWPIDDS